MSGSVAMAPLSRNSAGNSSFNDKDKPMQVRLSNITAAKAVADAVRTSLGPKGMDKMIESGKKEIVVSNDGATIMKNMNILHPAGKMLVDLSQAQDEVAGDGTTSVVIIAGSLLHQCERLLLKGIHPSQIAIGFGEASKEAAKVLEELSIPISLDDRELLIKNAGTSLNSKVVSQFSSSLAPLAVDAVLQTVEAGREDEVDLSRVRVVKKLGSTLDETALVRGLVLRQTVLSSAGGPRRMEKARIALVQFQLSAPKPDMDNQVVVTDYRQMDKILKEERLYLLQLVKRIKKAGCNVLLIQKSILRDAVTSLSLHFLAKLKIMAIKEIERDEIEFICQSTGCKPIADISSFTEDKLGYADLVEEVDENGARIVRVTGARASVPTSSIIVRGSNKLVLDEAERSLHDALCVVRCLVKKRALLPGGGAPEIEIARRLSARAKERTGFEALCFQAFADAFEIIPTTLAENAGLNPIPIVTELRSRHAQGDTRAGINVRKGAITDIVGENVVQPLLVSLSVLSLATETVRMILKIDDIVQTR